VDGRDIVELVVIWEHQDILVIAEQAVIRANLELQAIVVLEFQDSLVEVVILVYQVVQAIQELLVIQVVEILDIQALVVILVLLETLVHLDIVVSLEQVVILV